MESSSRAAIYVKVCDLDVCRMFYRDLLGLGEPSADSSFTTEFTVNDFLTLILVKCEAPYLEHASAATSWLLECDDARAVWDRIAEADYHAAKTVMPQGNFYSVEDPEGNVILLKNREVLS